MQYNVRIREKQHSRDFCVFIHPPPTTTRNADQGLKILRAPFQIERAREREREGKSKKIK